MLSQENEQLRRLQAFVEQERTKIIVLLLLGSMNLNSHWMRAILKIKLFLRLRLTLMKKVQEST